MWARGWFFCSYVRPGGVAIWMKDRSSVARSANLNARDWHRYSAPRRLCSDARLQSRFLRRAEQHVANREMKSAAPRVALRPRALAQAVCLFQSQRIIDVKALWLRITCFFCAAPINKSQRRVNARVRISLSSVWSDSDPPPPLLHPLLRWPNPLLFGSAGVCRSHLRGSGPKSPA